MSIAASSQEIVQILVGIPPVYLTQQTCQWIMPAFQKDIHIKDVDFTARNTKKIKIDRSIVPMSLPTSSTSPTNNYSKIIACMKSSRRPGDEARGEVHNQSQELNQNITWSLILLWCEAHNNTGLTMYRGFGEISTSIFTHARDFPGGAWADGRRFTFKFFAGFPKTSVCSPLDIHVSDIGQRLKYKRSKVYHQWVSSSLVPRPFTNQDW